MVKGEHVEIICSESIHVYENPELAECYKYDRTINGKVVLHGKTKKEIAQVILYIVDGNRSKDERADISKWCKKYSVDMWDYIRPIYKNGVIKPRYIINPTNNNLLVIHWIEVYPEYRGKGYSDKIVDAILTRYKNECGAVVVCPFPLQYSHMAEYGEHAEAWKKKMGFDSFCKTRKKAFRKVAEFWNRMGFRKIQNTDTYYLRT